MIQTVNKEAAQAAPQPSVVESLLRAMEGRCIGPPRGGRVVTVAGDPLNPVVFYFGACAGGVWKTEDAGMTWRNISDGFFKTASVGALAVAASDPNVIYAGMGEATIRLDVSHGDGVYKSTDGGKSWSHIGLSDTRHIGKIRIHPHNPDIVYVAALGHAFGPNEERGVFRSTDGGRSWAKVLYKSEKAGAIDLTLDIQNPRILYASIWQARRSFWHLSSGGPESGLYRSTDGGESWTEITNNRSLPEGIKGKIGIAASPVQSGRIWALVEAEKGAFFRSDDGGESWEKLTDNPDLRYRPWYFSHVIADTQDPDTVYVLNLNAWKSIDGGKTFTKIPTPHGDNHDLWIDPNNSRRMIEGNDGGACISFSGGETWSTIYNQLTAQFYRIAVDDQFHYRVYGTQQDNSSISVPSRTDHDAITWSDCYAAGTGESGFIAVHPKDPTIGFVGAVGSSPGGGAALQRYDLKTGQIRLVNVWPEYMIGTGPKDHKYRFPWTYPILFSPHDPKVLYTAGNVIFKTTNEGASWEVISPDLTRNDESKLGPSGGPITQDTTGAENYATISSLVESKHTPGLFWVGSDDGLVHLSKDGGRNWENITPPELPEWAYIHTIEESPRDPATVYIAATRYKLDDFQPYLYKTHNYGRSWQKITHGIPDNDFTRVIRADPSRPGLLYVGTETGLYISFDDGESWQRWQSNLPVAPIYDMLVKRNDLVLGTHGRSFWIIDNLTPLYQEPETQTEVKLYKPNNIYRHLPDLTSGWYEGEGKEYHIGLGAPTIYEQITTEIGLKERKFLDAGKSAPRGAVIYYYLAQKVEAGTPAALTFLDSRGQVIRTFTPKPPEETLEKEKETATEDQGPWMPVKAGTNRFIWDLRYASAHKVPGDKTVGSGDRQGALVTPGVYQVQLKIGQQTFTESFEVLKDNRVLTSQADLEAQLDLLLKIRDKLSATHDAVNAIRNVRTQLKGWEERLKYQENSQAITEAAAALKVKLDAIEDKLIVPENKYSPAKLFDFSARLNMQLAALVSVVGSADAAPTRQAREVFEQVSGRIDEQLAGLKALFETELVAFNNKVREANISAVVPPPI
jgi:photosystem II stability/assembly factor-like uncharacterized protein